MNRRALGVVALVCCLLLAGCNSAAVGLSANVTEVRETSDDGYLVTFTIKNTGNAMLHDGELRAYDSDGGLACVVQLERIHGANSVSSPASTTRQTVCASAPVVLVPTAAEPCEREPDKGIFSVNGVPWYQHKVSTYVGFEGGEHRVTHSGRVVCDHPGGDDVEHGHSPDRALFDDVIYRYLTTNANVSFVMSDPGRDWRQVPPNVSRSFHVATKRSSANASVNATVPASSVPAWFAERHLDENTSAALNGSAYLAVQRTLFDRNLTGIEAVPGDGSYGPVEVRVEGKPRIQKPGYYEQGGGWEYRPIRYGGATHHHTIVHVVDENATYELVVTKTAEYSGPAIKRSTS